MGEKEEEVVGGTATRAQSPQSLAQVYGKYEKESLERARGRGQNKLGVTNAQIRSAVKELMQGRKQLVLAAVVRAIGESYGVQKERMGQLRIRVVGALDTKNAAYELVKEQGVVYIRPK